MQAKVALCVKKTGHYNKEKNKPRGK